MKSLLSAWLVLFTCTIQAQSNSSEFKLESVSLQYGPENLYHGNQQYDDFLNTLQGGTFAIQNDSDYVGYKNYSNYRGMNYSAALSFRKGESKWHYAGAINFISRGERQYTFRKTQDYIVDTVYAPVPGFTYDDETGEYGYQIYYDSLLVDSVKKDEQIVGYNSQNIFVSGEIRYDVFTKNKYRFSTGIGLSLGTSVNNKITVQNSENYKLLMVHDSEDDYYDPVWYSRMPMYNPVAGTHHILDFTRINWSNETVKRNVQFNVRPYIPIRVEAQFADKGFFSKLGATGVINAGCEFQFVKGDQPRGRFFWNYQVGLFYRI